MADLQFNPENFFAGLGIGWGSALLLYRSRKQLKDISNAFRGRPSESHDVTIKGTDSRYLSDLVTFIQAQHLAGDRVKLQDIIVEPRFYSGPGVAEPPDDDLVQSVFHVVPIVPDLPYLHANYNFPTLGIKDLDSGDNAIAILGEQGSGRTTALHAIALWILGQVDFKPPPDRVQQQLDAEEEDINDEERAARLQNRLTVEQMAKQSLAKKRGEDLDDLEDERPRVVLRQLTPIYVHCANIIVSSREYGKAVDPAEPIVRAAQQYVRNLTRKTMPRGLYRKMERGEAVLLIDGFDDLPPAEQLAKLEWLRALRETYPQVFTIVAGPSRGYGGLVSAGFAPVFVRPWNDLMARDLADRWANAWTSISKEKKPESPHEEIIAIAKEDTRARPPFELTLKTWSLYEDLVETDYEDWVRRALGRHFPQESLGELLPKLTELAGLQLDEGFITVQRLEQIALRQPSIRPKQILAEEESADDFLASLETVREENEPDLGMLFVPDSIDETPVPAPIVEADVENEEEEVKPDSNVGKEYARLVSKLYHAGLLLRYRGNRYQFRHALLADYAASLAIPAMSAPEREQKVFSAAWNRAFMFAPLHSDVTEIVQIRLNAQADMLHTNLLDTARWLAYTPDRPEWRAEILRRLGNMLVAPTQYHHLRERIAAALVGSRDRGVMRVFATTLTHPKPIVRQLGVLGAGALQSEEAVQAVAKMLDDPDDNVKLAAGLALGAIGTPRALELMVDAFMEPNERLQQALAEAFAAIPEEGYPILYDAIHHEDMALRRAAVFGLRRINTPWALITLYKTSMEEQQWYVRNAAEMAFSGTEFGDKTRGPEAYPPPHHISWVRDWITSLDEVAQQSIMERDFLRKVMEEGREDYQELAALNIGRLGMADEVGLLYRALRHRSSTIREASHRGLSELQMHIGQPLPAPRQ